MKTFNLARSGGLPILDHVGAEFKTVIHGVPTLVRLVTPDITLTNDVRTPCTNFDFCLLDDPCASSLTATDRRISDLHTTELLPLARHSHRPGKYQQIMHVAHAARRIGVKGNYAPVTWMCHNRSGAGLDFGDHVELVLKANNGARGIGQVRFNRERLNPIKLWQSLTQDAERFNALVTQGDGIITVDTERGEGTYDRLVTGAHFQEFIPNVVQEYRVLGYGERLFLVARERTDGAYPQARCKGNGMVIPREDDGLVLSAAIRCIIHDLIKRTPIISVDVYELADGTQGIFEYSNEFAMDTLDLTWRKQFMINALTHVIEEAPL